MKIQAHLKEEGALRKQRYARAERFTLLTELLQNARCAGAFAAMDVVSTDAAATASGGDGHAER